MTAEELMAARERGEPLQVIDARPRFHVTRSTDMLADAVYRDPYLVYDWMSELAISVAACPRGTLRVVPARSVPHSETEFGGVPGPELSTTWLLLIYTVPSQPSRKRATVWREIKKLGAVYLRDGVCVLPEQPSALSSLRTLADRIHEMEGEASVVQGGHLDPHRAEALTAEFRAARAAEYTEISREADQLLAHIARETEHREFTYAELEELEQDLGKLKRWTDQVHARDYFAEPSYSTIQALLDRCEAALETFLDQASAEAMDGR